jgi:small subunit ribosomal protein S17
MAEAKTPQKSAAKKAPAKAAPKKAAASKETADGGAKGPKHTPRTPKPRGQRKTRIGYVVSDKMQKTIVVELEDRVRHPLYGKIIRTTKKVKAHDENSIAGIGDRVSLMETRPLSATKRWRLVDILEKAK